jgi:microcystin-dependent protein
MGFPNLVGRTPIGFGTGTGLTPRALGEKAGAYMRQLNVSEMPAHAHTLYTRFSNTNATNTEIATGAWWSRRGLSGTPNMIYKTPPGSGQLETSELFLKTTGAGEGHENRQPYLAVNFVISLNGVFPSRN